MTITTEMLLRAGCKISHGVAFDNRPIYSRSWVALQVIDGSWILWQHDASKHERRRFRVKAISVPNTGGK